MQVEARQIFRLLKVVSSTNLRKAVESNELDSMSRKRTGISDEDLIACRSNGARSWGNSAL